MTTKTPATNHPIGARRKPRSSTPATPAAPSPAVIAAQPATSAAEAAATPAVPKRSRTSEIASWANRQHDIAKKLIGRVERYDNAHAVAAATLLTEASRLLHEASIALAQVPADAVARRGRRSGKAEIKVGDVCGITSKFLDEYTDLLADGDIDGPMTVLKTGVKTVSVQTASGEKLPMVPRKHLVLCKPKAA